MTKTTPRPEVAALAPFIGAWDLEATFHIPEPVVVPGRATFEWILGGRFLLQRSSVEHPEAPDGYSVIGPDGDGFRQHYFDSRGVVRLYAMTIRDGHWTLSREVADFTPLDFAQRYVGAFEDAANTIRGRWDIKEPPDDWRLDFEIVFRRAGRPA